MKLHGSFFSTVMCLFVASSSDFIEGTQDVSFSPGQKIAIAHVHINDDSNAESTETFIVDLSVSHFETAKCDVKFGKQPKATVSIKDGKSDDCEITA